MQVHAGGAETGFGPREEVAWLRPLPSIVGRVPLGDATIDLDQREVWRGEQVQRLTPIETEALAYLIERAGTVVRRDALLRDVWGYADGVESETVAVCMRRLRAKLEEDPKSPEYLQTVRGVGWTLRLDHDAATEPVDELPRYRSRWVGRERLEQLVDALGSGRQLTIWGPAGIGKSRAAIELARHLEGAVERRIAHLGDAPSAAVALARVAQALDTPLPDLDPERRGARLAELLAARPDLVLVLDECEQWLAALAPLVRAHAGHLRSAWLLLTSRRRLGTDGEQVHALSSLDPDDAAQLFNSIASQRDASYDDLAERRHVDAIVRSVQGNALAIELAAARLDLEAPAALAAELTHDPALGVGRSVMRSIDALAPEHRVVLERLRVFRGDIDLDDAEGVLGVSHVRDSLRTLIDTALLQRRSLPAGVRLSLHAAVREALQDVPLATEVVSSHAAWYSARASELRLEALHDPEARRWLHEALDDLVAALAASLDSPEVARPLLDAIHDAHVQRGGTWWERTLGTLLDAGADPGLATTMRRYRAFLWMRSGELDRAEREFRAQLAETDDPDARAALAGGLGHILGVLRVADRDTATRWHQQGLDEEPSAFYQLALTNGLGLIAALHEDLPTARAHFERALELCRAMPSDLALARVLLNQVGVRDRGVDPAPAVAACLEAVDIAERFDDAYGYCLASHALGQTCLELGRHRDSRGALARSLSAARRTAEREQEGMVLTTLAWLDAETGQLERARRRVADAIRVLAPLAQVGHNEAAETGAILFAWAAREVGEAEARLRAQLATSSLRPPTRALYAALLGHLLRECGHPEQAEPLLRDADAHPWGATARLLLEGHDVDASALSPVAERMLRRLGAG